MTSRCQDPRRLSLWPKDGKQLEFVNFPAIKDALPGVRGEWTTTDAQSVLMARMK